MTIGYDPGSIPRAVVQTDLAGISNHFNGVHHPNCALLSRGDCPYGRLAQSHRSHF